MTNVPSGNPADRMLRVDDWHEGFEATLATFTKQPTFGPHHAPSILAKLLERLKAGNTVTLETVREFNDDFNDQEAVSRIWATLCQIVDEMPKLMELCLAAEAEVAAVQKAERDARQNFLDTAMRTLLS